MGAGGGSYGVGGSSTIGGAGGGAGEEGTDLPLVVVPAASVTVIVGAGGVGGASGGHDGLPGGTTTIGPYTFLGGLGGTTAAGASRGGPGGGVGGGIGGGAVLGTAESTNYFGGSAGGNGGVASNNPGQAGGGSGGQLTGGAAGAAAGGHSGGGGGAEQFMDRVARAELVMPPAIMGSIPARVQAVLGQIQHAQGILVRMDAQRLNGLRNAKGSSIYRPRYMDSTGRGYCGESDDGSGWWWVEWSGLLQEEVPQVERGREN